MASDKVYQFLAHGRWFSPDTSASSTTKTDRHDIAEILLEVALKANKSKSEKKYQYLTGLICSTLWFYNLMEIQPCRFIKPCYSSTLLHKTDTDIICYRLSYLVNAHLMLSDNRSNNQLRTDYWLHYYITDMIIWLLTWLLTWLLYYWRYYFITDLITLLLTWLFDYWHDYFITDLIIRLLTWLFDYWLDYFSTDFIIW